MKNNFIDTDKKGTVILTHYRSGGTQLRHIIDSFLEVHNIASVNVGEIDLDLEDTDFYDELFCTFFEDSNSDYKVIQLNNPLVISFIYFSSLFKKLNEQYHIVHLEREDHAKCLLSLPLWEKFIQEGYYELDEWDSKTMETFHNKYKQNPIRYTELYTGLHSQYNPTDGISYTNYIVMTFVNILLKNRSIADQLNIHSFFYEQYEEYSENFFKINFDTDNKEFLNKVKHTYKRKIPYLTNKYVEYFDQDVKDAISNWNL